MALAFTYAQYRDLVRKFGERIPALLAGHPATAELAIGVAQLGIPAALDGRFTVAVVGQMRVGKSTLLNALIGRDLAPTGVNETTATINWFRYGEGDLCDKFRVHWLDGSAIDLPLDKVTSWLGMGEDVARTRSLDFFATSEFLRTANLVDTPGTRSVLDTHEGATRGFLFDESGTSERCDDQTLAESRSADAVLYVLNPVARQHDSDLLQLFGDKTRMAGATVHNSIAVVQKWENLDVEDPLAEVEQRCAHLQQQLQGKVATVIPTSGLMAVTVRHAPPAAWPLIAQLACQSGDGDHAALVADPEIFCDPDDAFERIPVPQNQRKALLTRIPWPVLRFVLRTARLRGLATPDAVRQLLVDASGVERLRHLLAARFFANAELIKANTVLRRAWNPCSVGLLRLQQVEKDRETDLRQGAESLKILDMMPESQARNHVRGYVQRSLAAVAADLNTVRALRRQLDELRETARSNFEALDRDMRMIDEVHEMTDLAPDDVTPLLRLLGHVGAELPTRLDLTAQATTKQLAEKADELLMRWQTRATRGARHAKLYGYACERLDQILDTLESA